jgi:integrase
MNGRVIKRTWKSRGPLGRKVKHVAFGYSVWIDGKRERIVKSTWTKEEAEKELAARILNVEQAAKRKAEPDVFTFGALTERYLAHKAATGKRAMRNDRGYVKAHLLPFFGTDTPVTDVTAEAIARYQAHRAAAIEARQRKHQRDVISYAACNREVAVLRHMLRLAKRWRLTVEVPEIDMLKEPEGRLRFLTEEEAVRLLDACSESRNPYLPAIVTVALHTGLRKGEILGLTWDRVDFSRGVVRVTRTKNGRSREIPMDQDVYEALSGLKGRQDIGLVFARQDGGAWGQIRTAFAVALRRAGIEDFRFHDLRHTAASHWTMRGASLKEVQELLGHQSITMTMRYAHLSPERLRTAVARLEGLGRSQAPESGTQVAQRDRIRGECLVSPCAPVAQVDRAAVS